MVAHGCDKERHHAPQDQEHRKKRRRIGDDARMADQFGARWAHHLDQIQMLALLFGPGMLVARLSDLVELLRKLHLELKAS